MHHSTHPPVALSFPARLFSGRALGWWAAAVVAFYLFCAVTAGLRPKENTLDYPIEMLTAERVLHGERPYADFAALYGPVGHYLIAAGIWPLGFLPLAEAGYLFFGVCSLIYGAVAVRAVMRLRNDRPPLAAILLGCIAACAPFVCMFSYYSLLSVLLLIATMAAARCAFADDVPRKSQILAMMGLALLSVALVLTRFNFGVYAIFAGGLTAGLRLLLAGKRALPQFLMLASALAIATLLFVAILAVSGIGLAYVQDLVAYLPRYKSRHYPLLLKIQHFEPLILLLPWMGLAVVACIWAAFKNRRELAGGTLFSVLLLPCLAHYSLGRFDWEHAGPLALLLPLTLAQLLETRGDSPELSAGLGPAKGRMRIFPKSFPLRLAFVSTVMIALGFAVANLRFVRSGARYLAGRAPDKPDMVIRNGVQILASEAAMLDAIRQSSGGAPVFLGSEPGACESTTQAGANIALYLAQGVTPTQRIWFFDTPSTPYPEVQKVLIDPAIDYLPGNPHESLHFREYVNSHYSEKQRFTMPERNRYYILYRRNGEAP